MVSSGAPGEEQGERQEEARAEQLVGLVGYPVEHSLSPAMQNAAFASLSLPYRYVLLPATPGEFAAEVGRCVSEGFAGWNVTVPHKERMVS
ncbi:MAG TPA: hypothetical protein VND68_12175, partial [Chloroflexia bacterium]|nr:hypothetical protein [Chloroflexia bacterium]